MADSAAHREVKVVVVVERVAIDFRAAAAEGLAMFMFVIIGCGTACGYGASSAETKLIVAMAFGWAILVLAYGFAHHSGAQINCAVTFALVLGGCLHVKQGLANLAFQLLGSVLGACFLCIMFPCDVDRTQSLGTNIISDSYGYAPAFFGEVFGTFLLCYTVFETAVNPKANVGVNYAIAIGFAVFLAHVLLLPIDGCSINPTRSFGPAVVGAMRDCPLGPGMRGVEHLWLMWFGPLVGAAIAAGVKRVMRHNLLLGSTTRE